MPLRATLMRWVRASRTPRAASGARAERAAARYLRWRGLRVVRRNYRTRRGEIDLVMRDGSTLVFVEVRYRSRSDFVAPGDTVDAAKRARLIATASHFLDSGSRGSPPRCRFDVVSVTRRHYRLECQWIKDAFTS